MDLLDRDKLENKVYGTPTSNLNSRGAKYYSKDFRHRMSEKEDRETGEHHDMWNSQVASVSFDALGGTEALAIVRVAHACVAITLAGWKNK